MKKILLVVVALLTFLINASLGFAQDLKNVDLTNIISPTAILIEAKTSKVIAKKYSDRKIYPASMVKMMTGLIVSEHMNRLQRDLTVPADIFPYLNRVGASTAGFVANEKVQPMDLLYGVMLPSGAEAAITLARAIGGSEQRFVAMMNDKAKKLGMKNTNFTNTTGLPNTNQYSTVEDMSILLQEVLKDKRLKRIISTDKYRTSPTKAHPKRITMESTIFKFIPNPKVTNGELLGGKTGYTRAAGLCLASFAKIGGTEYILVTAGAPGTYRTKRSHFIDALAVYNDVGEKTLPKEKSKKTAKAKKKRVKEEKVSEK